MELEKPRTSCVLRSFGASARQMQQLCAELARSGATVQRRSKGAETLLALQAQRPETLKKAVKNARKMLDAAVYGEENTALSQATVWALEQHHCLLTSADAQAGALLEQRLGAVPGAQAVFDFGTVSYADEHTAEQIDRTAHRRAKRPGDLELAAARVWAARRLVDTELAVGCLERGEYQTLLVGSAKGCWLRTIRTEDSPALWLLDMIRRAACGASQAEGTLWMRWKDPVPEQAMSLPGEEMNLPLQPKQGRGHGWRKRLFVLVLLMVLLSFAAVWYHTGGDLTALPQLFRNENSALSGARLI